MMELGMKLHFSIRFHAGCLPIRASYFDEPGPATTGVPLPILAYENMNIEIDIYAMAEADD
jgi:hypothetical protein